MNCGDRTMLPSERRRYERVPFSTELTVIDARDRRRYKGWSIDLSLGGMSFFAERFLQAGSRIAILARLPGSRDGPATPVEATVQWSRVEADGAVMGAEFTQALSNAFQPQLYEALCSV